MVGAKFIVDRRCTVKTSLTLTGLIEGLKQQGLLRRVTELAAAGVLPAQDPDTRLEAMVTAPEDGVPGTMTVRELHERAEALRQHRLACRQCPSSLHGFVGGCITYMPYPLSEGLEYLLWVTAVRALEGNLPGTVLSRAQTFAQRAQRLVRTSFSDALRARGDLLGPRPHVYSAGALWRKERLTSAQVLDAFFVNGLLSGDDLRLHKGFLAAVLVMASAMESAMSSEERRVALLEDIEPYSQAHELMEKALEQGLGVYAWP